MVDVMRDKLKELNLTSDEVKRFSEALKKDEFRKLLVDYANELSDPANRKLYEEEIEKLENERGVDVKFVNPEPGFVLKTTQNGIDKVFINICKNENIQKPSSEIRTQDGKKGLVWSIPHSSSPMREDLDNSGKKCYVYDIVFHPDSYRMSETNANFKKMLQDSAIETIEKNFKVKIDTANVKQLKLSFKGNPVATVIRKARDNQQVKQSEPQEDLISQLKTPYKYPPEEKIEKKTGIIKEIQVQNEYTTPKYTIINRGHADLQDCVNDLKFVVNSTRPKEIVVEIDLPLCKSANELKLDIFEKRLYLESNKPNYKLDLNLPYPVNENDGGAKFDKAKKRLSITLPVKEFKAQVADGDILVRPLTPPVTPPPTENEYSEEFKEAPQAVTVELAQEKEKPISMPINYILPTKTTLKQDDNCLKLEINVNNVDKESVKIEKLTKTSFFCKYESCGAGCYVNYYSIYVKFDSDFIDLTRGYKFFVKNDNFIQFEFVKLKEKCLNKAKISLNEASKEIVEYPIESIIEENAIEILSKIQKDEEIQVETIKTDLRIISNEKVVVTFDELDEDDDQDETQKSVPRSPTRVRSESHNETTTSSDDWSSSSSSTRLKGILKKPRSVSESAESYHLSESESALANRVSSSDSSGENVSSSNGQSQEHLKKSVSFNKQIVKTIFKPNSAIATTIINKSKTEKNRKRNSRRKRTISDPSHAGDEKNSSNGRYRSLSESSDEYSSSGSLSALRKDSNDSSDDKINSNVNNGTILQWNEAPIANSHETPMEKTKCAFKFSNRIMNDLDD